VSNTVTASWVIPQAFGLSNTDEKSASDTCQVGGRIKVTKLTEGVVNPDQVWTFGVFDGPNADSDAGTGDSGFLDSPLATTSTLNVLDGMLVFDNLNLDPDNIYTVCELEIPDGWSTEWRVDTDGDGIPDTIVIPYNPNQSDDPAGDLGNRCFDFGAGTTYPVTAGGTLVFEVNNTFPGGEPRTPGYWKNWNTCTSGNQARTAAKNGGAAEGFFLLDDILNDPGVTWGTFTIATCVNGVSILDQRKLATAPKNAGKKVANDAAYTLAMHLLAAQLNLAAGAETCQEAQDAAVAAEALLVSLGFDGTGSYLRPKDAEYQTALELAATLDAYSNGELCQ
jgi:hypothetical protein